ncbi:heme/hemin ABC transporter substrate-binding protein [Isoalcanivorax indicus]|uniref:heme/hemin ABC transporter substrate-binding protein n=1 Tax=Isoalcanivorax indicus TaxID=2202653 RepID=UPI0013C47C20|nr:ABC transporter substrate-binding protein [Isoalcanivorax indicus]
MNRRGRVAVLAALLLVQPASAQPALEQRLVVAGGAVTEMVYALGAEDQLVAVDDTSVWPPAARALPKIGYVRALPVEGIASLRPDKVLVSADEAGPARTLRQLERVTKVVPITAAHSAEGVLARAHQVAAETGREEAGAALVAQLEAAFARINERLPLADPPRVLCLLSAGSHGVRLAGRDTKAQALLDSLGLPNAVGDQRGYRPLSSEALLALAPDMVIIAETVPGEFRAEDWPALGMTPAARAGRILVADSMLLLGFGPRLPEAMAQVLDVATGAGEGEANAERGVVWSR